MRPESTDGQGHLRSTPSSVAIVGSRLSVGPGAGRADQMGRTAFKSDPSGI